MHRIIALSLILLAALASLAFGQVTTKGMEKAIDKNKLKHPYLYFSEADKPAILERIKNDKTIEQGGWRGIQWSLFPAPVFESFDDPLAQKLIKKLATDVEEKATKKHPGFAYLGEQVFILGIATAKQPEYKPLMDKAVKILVNEVPMPGADCYGEVTIWIDMPGQGKEGKVAQQRTSIPHLWTGVTTYLAVESLYRPERFLSQIPPVPK